MNTYSRNYIQVYTFSKSKLDCATRKICTNALRYVYRYLVSFIFAHEPTRTKVLKFEDADGIVGLQNGCACCSGRHRPPSLHAISSDCVSGGRAIREGDADSSSASPEDRSTFFCSRVAQP